MVGNNIQSDALKRPFPAYEGNEPYIFISYAHRDAQLVFPEIKRFHDEGYPVWYDQGLTPGQEWDDEVADALLKSSLLVVFISKNSMASNNVQDEIKLSLDEGIDIVPIYLEETKLPSGLRLRLSNKHAIFKHTLIDNDYISDCFKAFDKAKIPKTENMGSFHNDADYVETIEEEPKNNNISEKLGNPDVFISYSSKDWIVADKICRFLEYNGLKCWTAHGDIKTGMIPDIEIFNGMFYSKMVLCIFSANAQKSSNVPNEMDLAFSMDKPILSFFIDEQLPKGRMASYLNNAQWFYAVPNPEDKFDNLLDYVKSMVNDSKTCGNDVKPPFVSKSILSGIDMSVTRKKKVYICYDSHDEEIADSVCKILEEYMFNCWLKSRDVSERNIVDGIREAIISCDVVVLIYSKYSMNSNFVNVEIDEAFSNGKQIIVFKVDESGLDGPLHFFLIKKTVIDASSDYNDYLYTLVNGVYYLANKSNSSKGLFKSIKKSLFK